MANTTRIRPSALGVDLAMNCATTNAFFLKLTVMERLGNRSYRPENAINPVNLVLDLIRNSHRYPLPKGRGFDGEC